MQQVTGKEQAVYTIPEIAKALSCSQQHVHNLIEAGRLQATNIATDPSKRAAWRISAKSFEQFLNQAA